MNENLINNAMFRFKQIAQEHDTIDFDAPHVVVISQTDELAYGMLKSNYHIGAKRILKYAKNWQEAQDFVDDYKKKYNYE